uniref:Uncharacterized protein n=1 Tax=Parascaris equorum TaxID=6256 RepID=A0A914RLR2_PAREQ
MMTLIVVVGLHWRETVADVQARYAATKLERPFGRFPHKSAGCYQMVLIMVTVEIHQRPPQ